MKAWVIEGFGSSDVFKKVELPEPKIKAGHVLVRVKASSVNPVDYKIRNGSLAALAPTVPMILHGDLAGIVEEVGEGSSFQRGDEVFGFVGGVATTPGVLADFALADTRLLAKKPASLTFEEAAALPLVTITAWEALIDRFKIKMGDHVLVHGGSGGTGHIAIQLAKLQGAKVFATVSSQEKAEVAKTLGADEVIYYTQESVQDYVAKHTGGKGFDVVFDTVGGENINRAFEAVAINGHISSIMTFSTHDLSMLQQKGVSFHAIFMLLPLIYNQRREHHGDIMKRVAELASMKKLRPWIDSEKFSFDEVGKAHQKLEQGRVLGKAVLSHC